MKKILVSSLILILSISNISFAESNSNILMDKSDSIVIKSLNDLELVTNSLDMMLKQIINKTINNNDEIKKSIDFNKSIIRNIANTMPKNYDKLDTLNLKNKYLQVSKVASDYAVSLSCILLHLENENSNNDYSYLYNAIVNFTNGKYILQDLKMDL